MFIIVDSSITLLRFYKP